jgi:tetratricopeptide (TPR) repeat protein
MARSSAPGKTTKKTPSKSTPFRSSPRGKSKADLKTKRGQGQSLAKTPPAKAGNTSAANKKVGSSTRKSGSSAPAGAVSLKTKIPARNAVAAPPEAPAKLLRDLKTTSAALSLLEKGIRLLHQKEIKRARAEFRSLLEAHPGEPEILARARSYIQICDREEPAHKKPAVTHDQLYTLGVMDHNRGNYDGAIAYFRQSIEKHANRDYIYYSLAASLAMKGDTAGALKNLEKALDLNEENRVYAKNDPDFSSLHTLKDFRDLFGLTQTSANEPSPL